MNPNARTAVVFDRFPLWLDAVEQVLRRVGVEVIGKAVEPAAALDAIEKQQPGILVADVEDDDAVQFLGRARKLAPDVKVIAMSRVDELAHVDATFAAGAVAYVLKTADSDDLALAIRQTFAQSVYFAGSRTPEASPATEYAAGESASLTRREREILQLVARGSSNAQMARTLWVTEQTVKFHLSNVYRKLGVANRTEATRWAHVNGLAPTPSNTTSAAA